jgi:Porin PorA
MRRFGLVLFVIGVFLLVIAALSPWYLAPRLEKVPVDTNTELTLVGEGRYDPGGSLEPVTLSGTRTVHALKPVSTADVVVYDFYVIVNRKTGSGPETSLSQSSERFAVDRHTGLAVPDVEFDTVDGAAVDHSGLVVKFPFHTQKKDYDFFDARAKRALPARFSGVENVEGLQVYRFVQDVPKMPATLSLNQPGMYQNTRTIWVEPTTGLIVKGQEEQQFWLTGSSEVKIAELTIGYADESVRDQVDRARAAALQVQLIGLWLPLVALVLGVVLTIGGLLLRLRPARSRRVETRREPDSGPLTDILPRHAAS